VRAIAEEHPNLKIVIAHLAQPRPDIETNLEHSKLWHQQIGLGLLQNVWFDCAALPAYLPGEDFPYLSAGKYLRLAIEHIGPHKVMWGSDIPGILSHASYPQLVKMAWLHTGFLSPSEQNQVLWENASHVYGI
jgi:predicted TIM-barrel fold metal-dependent hydrolase